VGLEELDFFLSTGSEMSSSPLDTHLQDLARLDFLTYQHSVAVAEAMREFALKLGFDEESALEAELLGAIHDLAKLKVDPGLFKRLQAGELPTREDRDALNQPPQILLDFLGEDLMNENVVEAVKAMGARFDGSGSPNLMGEAIPQLSRMLLICDISDMLGRQRPGRQAMGEGQIQTLLERQSGKLFDPVLVEVFQS